jgi:plasmid stabilization system protein ParE
MTSEKYRVRWTLAASEELESIGKYIARDKPAAALRVTNDIFDLAESLAQHPFLGAMYPYCPEARHVTSYNYVIYYVVEEHEVIIRAIAHGARKFRRSWLKRH